MSKMFNSENRQRFIINQDKDEMYPLDSLMYVSIVVKDDICYGYNILMALDSGDEALLGTYDTYEAAVKEIDRISFSDYIYETVMQDDYDLSDEDEWDDDWVDDWDYPDEEDWEDDE